LSGNGGAALRFVNSNSKPRSSNPVTYPQASQPAARPAARELAGIRKSKAEADVPTTDKRPKRSSLSTPSDDVMIEKTNKGRKKVEASLRSRNRERESERFFVDGFTTRANSWKE
jgi:hypothetical protein